MTPLSIATAARHLCARIAGNLICGVPDADMLTLRYFAVHVAMILILTPGAGKGRIKKRHMARGLRRKVFE